VTPSPSSACAVCPSQSPPAWKFADLIADPAVRARWEQVRRYFFLRESTYDMTRRCNIRCQGCYYYEGDKQHSRDNRDPEAWRRLMLSEKARGITFVVLAGAEPSLVPELLTVCHAEQPLGAIATNGLIRIAPELGYRLHISVWGSDATSLRLRGAEGMLARQIENYRGDTRAIFVYTFTRDNVAEVHAVADTLAAAGCRLTFNLFSAPVGYDGPLRHTPASLRAARHAMQEVMGRLPATVLYSHGNLAAHTHRLGLHALYGCPYPRVNPSVTVGLGKTFRQYRSDLSWDRAAACCVPDTDCDDCRHYAAGSAVVPARLFRHASAPDTFHSWLDYMDTYLAVWVSGYAKGEPLCQRLVPPPGHVLEPL
jgi:MoaA/NifB/PqqE/SkfB family radical SAM enzyme